MAAAVAGCARGTAAHEAADAGADAAADAAPDAAPDAHLVTHDGPPACAISAGMTLALDGAGDLAKYPSAQHVALGAMLGSDDAALAWDQDQLYITVTSPAFADQYQPLHVYLETALPPAVASQGKEYSGLVPQLPFTPDYLIALRRVSSGYDAVYAPAMTWDSVALALAEGHDVLVSADNSTISVRVPWSALGGCPTALRMSAHVVHAVAGNEWKDLAPATATPWQTSAGGYYEIDLTGSTSVAEWVTR